ncbi:MAG: folate family ECF transporter S component [Oscillospiraceae bacterium]|nr:folate family ECF transporter S component [Oscillospiraceae bacterium]
MLKNFKNSFYEFKKTRTICACALLIAFCVVLDFATIQISASLHVTLSFLPIAIIGYLYGPFCAGFCGALADVLKWFANPKGPFYPHFTLSALLIGVIFGIILYNRKNHIVRVFVAVGIGKILVSTLLNSVFLAYLYNIPFWLKLSEQAVKNAMLLPIEAIVLYFMCNLVDKIKG